MDANERVPGAQRPTRSGVALLALVAVLAATGAAIFPLTPGFSRADTSAAVIAALVTAALTVAIVPLADRLGRGIARAAAAEPLVLAAALASAGAGAIHLSVAKMHFDEYTLFGLFFVGSGIAQLAWPVWLLLQRSSALLVLGAAGNALIVAIWAVDRLWGLPLGPDPWQPDPVGFGDTVTSAFELLLVGACGALLIRGGGAGRRRTATVLVLTLGVGALTTMSLLSVIGVGSAFLTPTE